MNVDTPSVGEAIERVLLFQEQQDASVLPESVQTAETLEDLPHEYAVIAAALLCNALMPASLPIDIKDPRDVRFLNSTYSYAIERENALKMHQEACTDALTGLMNRTGLHEWLSENYREDQNTYAVLAIDLKDFKAMNDKLGHDAGDAALVQFSDIVGKFIRISSATESSFTQERQNDDHKDILARVGGDEFYIVMDLNGVGPEKAQEITKRVIVSIENMELAVRGRSGESRSHGIRIDGVISTPDNPLTYTNAMTQADDLCNIKRTAGDR